MRSLIARMNQAALKWGASTLSMLLLPLSSLAVAQVPQQPMQQMQPMSAVEQSGVPCTTCETDAGALYAQFPQQQAYSSGACQACIAGIDCRDHCGRETRWGDMRPMNFQPLMHGEFIGPVRLPAMVEYRVRVGDQLQIVYIDSREASTDEYRLQVGDEIQVSSVNEPNIQQGDLNRGIQVQPDGTIFLRWIGKVQAAGMTYEQLRVELEERYKKYLNAPAIDVGPVKSNTKAVDLRQAITNLGGFNSGQAINADITPDGKIQLPLLGDVRVYGMTIPEMKEELNLRYRDIVTGIAIEPRLVTPAAHFVSVFGLVNQQGRFQLQGPTTVTQALALAGGLQLGANNRKIVIMRRAEDWRLITTIVDLNGAHLGTRPTPSDEIWVRDSDTIIVPPTPVRQMNNFVRQYFTEGIYAVVPFGGISIQLDNNNNGQ